MEYTDGPWATGQIPRLTPGACISGWMEFIQALSVSDGICSGRGRYSSLPRSLASTV